MYMMILIFPIVSVITVGLCGRFFGRKGAIVIANMFLFLTFLLACLMFFEVNISGITVYFILGKWFYYGETWVYWTFLFDSVTCTMLVVITSISTCVHLYSISYMEQDKDIIRFMALLSLFTFFMIFLVISGNFLQLFFGWEGVGVTSFLLVNFWSKRLPASSSGIKAILINKIADCGIFFSICLLQGGCHSMEFFTSFTVLENHNGSLQDYSIVEWISLGLFIGAVGKSAQLGLHIWLPDAMEGPTPVSALIHAATMVTAGVFVLIRISPILICTEIVLVIITVFGAVTGFFAGCIGILQNDLKRVIAYSTCSQLGYMVMSCGLANFSLALFHLMNHAFFKALLFLSAGAVIHAIGDQQDMRKMGGLVNLLPLTYSLMFIGSLSLMGFPYTTGYYSKELILELAYVQNTTYGIISYWLLLLGAACTALYSTRLLYLTFISEIQLKKEVLLVAHECTYIMAIPMLCLGFGSIFFGYIFKDLFIGCGVNTFGESIGTSLAVKVDFLAAEFLDVKVKLIPVFLSMVIGLWTFIYYLYNFVMFSYIYRYMLMVYRLLNKKFYIDTLVNKLSAYFFLIFGLVSGILKHH